MDFNLHKFKKELQPTENIIFIHDIKLFDQQGKQEKKTLALISTNLSEFELALFIIKKKRNRFESEAVLAICSDWEIMGGDESTLSIKLPDITYKIKAPSNTIQHIQKELARALRLAQKSSFSSKDIGETHHSWILNYRKDGNEQIFTDVVSTSPKNRKNSQFKELENENEAHVSRSPMFSKLREEWIHHELMKKKAEFSEKKPMRVLMGTWNVNSQKPEEDISDWVRDDNGTPDIIALGFQEIDMTASAIIGNDHTKAKNWEDYIQKMLEKHPEEYVPIKTKLLAGIMVCVYVKKIHSNFISDIQVDDVAVGVMGILGNKGAVAVKFNCYDSNIIIINSHLACHLKSVNKRNQDQRNITNGLTFNDKTSGKTIFDSDMVFWFGDLNYRISFPDKSVKAMIEKKEFDALFEKDQLQAQMKAGVAFSQFKEPKITFAPTYKYDPQSDNYDTSEKKRIPAWCDRILYYGNDIECEEYRRHEFLSSDHKAVSSIFTIQVNSIIPEKRREYQNKLIKELDRMENESIPNAAINAHQFSFKDMKYNIPVTQSLILSNTGSVWVQFKFIPKLNESEICKPWITVDKNCGIILPGCETKISLTVLVDNNSALLLNSLNDVLDDILIIHLENGKDHFISVTGNYLRSCFATSLETLVNQPRPIRFASLNEKSTTEMSIPKELWRMTNYIYNNGLHEPNIFLETGDTKEMEQIRECLDTDQPFSIDATCYSMAESILMFLSSLPVPVIPYTMYKACIENSSSYIDCLKIVKQLPSAHYHVFIYIISFIRELLKHSKSNSLNPENIAYVFSSVILRPPFTDKKQVLKDTRKRLEFLLHFVLV